MVRLCRGVGRHYAIACMMALAVGNLCGDAILHLIPEAFSLGHDHGSRDNHNDNHEDDSMYRLSGGFVVNDVRLKCLALLGSVYLFWLLEIFTSRYHECVQPGSGKKTVAKEPSVSTISGDYNGAQSIPMSSLAEMTEVSLSGQTRDRESTYEIITPQVLGQAKPVVTEIAEFKASSRHLVWMIVVGDAVHNLADGLAIGAAFAHSIPLGLSTSMAVVCHEIPHELGDFAVLMSTGMKMRKALLLNLLSALTAFVGLYIGLGIGAQLAHRQWIFIIVAGMFLYVSLADLVPELIRYFRHFRNFRMFILQSVGLLSGFALMFLLVLLEDVLHF
ncbi:zinc transporter ZIP4-like [Littorina saxatilis]|uniref:zinc transporter ZIP4-like n=1 Tax=Littorina saxatilis TaxID=31220 RepID=UPI0038B68E45